MLAYILGVIGSILGAAGLVSIGGSEDITETCLKCGGTGKVTAVNENHLGYQCENCKSYWKKQNKDKLTINDLEE